MNYMLFPFALLTILLSLRVQIPVQSDIQKQTGNDIRNRCISESNDLCIDMGFCPSREVADAHFGFIQNIVRHNKIGGGKFFANNINDMYPPGFFKTPARTTAKVNAQKQTKATKTEKKDPPAKTKLGAKL